MSRREWAITVGRYRTPGRDVAVTLVAGAVLSVAGALMLHAAHPADAWQVAASTVVGLAPAAAAAALVLRRVPPFTAPADRVTFARAALACGCAAMTALALIGPAPARNGWLFGLSVPTLLLDAVDGQVARRTGTATDAGGRLDMEIDAVVLVVLSLAVASALGWWVVLIGAMRYLYAAATWVRPRLATPLPRSRFRVVVAGVQGAALAGALAPFAPTPLATSAVAAALALLLASFSLQSVLAERTARPLPMLAPKVAPKRGEQ
jgi:phosphatidylglycerophosphate synthase